MNGVASWFKQHQHRVTHKLAIISFCLVWLIWVCAWHTPSVKRTLNIPEHDPTPLVTRYIEDGRGDGGRWFIPNEWFSFETRLLQPYPDVEHYMDIRNPRTPAEAAQIALELCMRRGHYLRNSKIPLIVHQTWKNSDSRTWNQLARDGAEAWLQLVTGVRHPDLPKMVYIFWDDKAVNELIALYEPELWPMFAGLPHAVEKADIFRVAVVKWFGGVYVDMDTIPLQHPYEWIQDEDLMAWRDPSTGESFHLDQPSVQSYIAPTYAPFRPNPWPDSPSDNTPATYTLSMELYGPRTVDVAAIFGIEADTKPGGSDHWRAGYTHSQQLTNWALAMAPQHPVAGRFINRTIGEIYANLTRITQIDPLDLTGPPALTSIVKAWAKKECPSLVWESVSCLNESAGGRGKIVASDVLILPITGFSPGRGRFHNMGSQSVEHPNARLAHVAQGSWRHTSARVEAGKFCRTFLGGCRDWSKVP